MKIEVKDYNDVCEREEYWRGAYNMANVNSIQKCRDEMMKWYRLQKHLEELAGVKEEE